MQIARVKLSSPESHKVDEVARQIKEIAEKFGAAVSGPIPLPTKRLRVVTRKAVSGRGSETYEKWEMRIHKRVLDIGLNDRALRHIMRIEVPDGVHVEIELKEK